MATTKKYRGLRFSIVLQKPVAEKVKAFAESEGRPLSQMIARLVDEAIAARESKSE